MHIDTRSRYVISFRSEDLVILEEKLWTRAIVAIPMFIAGCVFASVSFPNDANPFSHAGMVGLLGYLLLFGSFVWLFVRGAIRINGVTKTMMYRAWSHKFVPHPVRVELTRDSSV
jgi:hypothetical protein